MRPERAGVVLALLAATFAAAAPARADEALATVDFETPVVREGATIAWLTGPRGVVAYRTGRGPVVTTTVAAGEDLGAGRDARGRVTLTWSACSRTARSCPVLALRPGQTRARRIARVSRAGTGLPRATWREQDLAPVLAGRRLITARVLRRQGRYDVPCSVPVVTRPGSGAAARPLAQGACGRILRMDVAGPRVGVLLTAVDFDTEGTAQQLQVAPLGGGPAREIAFLTSGETANAFGGFGVRGRTVMYALPGGTDRPPRIGRLALATGRRRIAAAGDLLAGGFAPGAYLRTEIPGSTFEDPCNPAVPCTVVATGDPFGRRTLARRLVLDDRLGPGSTVTGRVERRRVGPRGVRSVAAQAGVPVRLFDVGASDFSDTDVPSRAAPTDLRGVTDRRGRFAIPVPPGEDPTSYVARTDDAGVAATGFTLPR